MNKKLFLIFTIFILILIISSIIFWIDYKKTKNDEIKANPAPGPIYASAISGVNDIISTTNIIIGILSIFI